MPSESKHGAAVVRYNQKQDQITLRPSREIGSRIRKAASDAGVPLQRFIVQIVMDRIEEDERKMQ
jgi:predicted DNA binding CopG/RHH family protein